MRAASADAHGKPDAQGAAAGALADAPRSNWVDRFAPDSLKPWLRLTRADRPIGVVAAHVAMLVVRGIRGPGGT